MISSTIIGIDLGTTHCACAVYEKDSVTLIPNRLNQFLTPSVISFKDKQLLIGESAKHRLVTHPDESVSTFKRHMGTSWTIRLKDEIFTATELSALMLKSLKEDASVFLNKEITQAVVSVPAYFNNQQREATIHAGKIAGLEIKALINEPTAAAIAFGLHEKPDDHTFMVLDLGGGTFDISIMEYYDKILEVQATAGDNLLGGEDFTDTLISLYLEKNSLTKKDLTSHQYQKIYFTLENAKKSLNEKENIIIPVLFENTQETSISQSEFMDVSKKLIRKIQDTIKQAILDSKINISDIDDLLLVGGSSRLQLFRDISMKLLKRIPSNAVDPDLAIAIGSAIQAGLKSKNEELDDVVLTDVSSYSFGVGINNPNNETDLLYSPLIERNSVIPISRTSNYVPIHENQDMLRFKVYQGEHRLVKDNLYLGELIVDIPNDESGKLGADVRFSYDSNGVLEIDVTVTATQKQYNKVILTGDRGLTESEIEITLNRLKKFKQHPREDEENIHLISIADKLYTFATGDLRENILNNIKWFESILETQDRKKIKASYDEFSIYLSHIQEKLNVFE